MSLSRGGRCRRLARATGYTLSAARMYVDDDGYLYIAKVKVMFIAYMFDQSVVLVASHIAEDVVFVSCLVTTLIVHIKVPACTYRMKISVFTFFIQRFYVDHGYGATSTMLVLICSFK